MARSIATTFSCSMATNGSPELLIVMGAGATADQTEHVLARLQEAGVDARVTRGREATGIGPIGERGRPGRARGDRDRRDRGARAAGDAPVGGLPGGRAGAADPEAVQARRARGL